MKRFRQLMPSARRRPTPLMLHVLRRAWPVLAIGFIATVPLACEQGDGFQCGTLLPGSKDSYRQCDGPHEVCVCATNSCARRDASCEDTGLRYLDNVFAHKALRDVCVDASDGDKAKGAVILAEGAGNVSCVNPDAGPQDSGGGGGGGSQSSSNSSNSSSGGGQGGNGGSADGGQMP